MRIEHLQHKHGGRITDLFSIEHEAQPMGMVTWFFTGRVEWSDGGVSEKLEISPICLCYDQADTAAQSECSAAMDKLNDYLARNGKWSDRGRGGWKPKAKRGSEELA